MRASRRLCRRLHLHHRQRHGAVPRERGLAHWNSRRSRDRHQPSSHRPTRYRAAARQPGRDLAWPAQIIGSLAMNLHPLTPRKPRLPAALASATAFLIVLLLGIAVHFIAMPPLASLPATDEASAADLSFMFLMARTLLGEALSSPSLSSRIDGILTLPLAIVDALRFLDLHVSLAIRTAAILLAAMVSGMTAHKLVMDRTLA